MVFPMDPDKNVQKRLAKLFSLAARGRIHHRGTEKTKEFFGEKEESSGKDDVAASEISDS
jgi:hypothetical protein